jgi:hypothetical protein
MPVAQATRPRMLDRFTLRMLGEDVTFTRSQWLDLVDELRPDGDLRRRIDVLISGEPDSSIIDDVEAREIASRWTLEGSDAVSSFAESGRIEGDLVARICWRYRTANREHRAELAQLRAYAEHHGERPRVDGWEAI